MGYDQYREYLKTLTEDELAKELHQLKESAKLAQTERAKGAWGTMLQMAQTQDARNRGL